MPEGCEKMSKQGDAAYAWFLKGYNCSQSVVAAFAPQLGLTEEMALRLSAGFGAGIGRMREVCGAFCGVVTVLSMVYADPADPKDKSRMYAWCSRRQSSTAPATAVAASSAGSCWQRRVLPLPGAQRQRNALQTIIKSAPARSCAAFVQTYAQNLSQPTRRGGTAFIRRMRKCNLSNWN